MACKGVTLFSDIISPPVRYVLMAAKLMDIHLDIQSIDLFNGDQNKENFVKINPHKKVPVLQDSSVIICDSHAISIYLCDKYKNYKLYPNELHQRAKINELLFYNSSTLFPLNSTVMTNYFAGAQNIEIQTINKWNDSLDILEVRLNNNDWLAGNKVTLADLCLFSTISSFNCLAQLNIHRHTNINKWMNRINNTLSCSDINKQGIEKLMSKLNSAKLIC